MTETIVEIKNLSHRYSKDWAVKNINLKISDSGVIGLLGSNGAGKSTTMNILCGVITQTQGEVSICGIDVNKNPVEAKSLLGFLPQKAPLYPELTVREYLFHCAHLRKIKKADILPAIEIAMEKCGISHYSERLINNLSGGYQQRVGLAQAIIHNPSLVVLDEPTNGLDPIQILEVRKLISEIGKNRLVIISTHILSEVKAICDKIVMIEKGKLVFEGSINEFNNYIVPNALIANFSKAPTKEALLSIQGVLEVESLDSHNMKIRIDEKSNALESIIRENVNNNWGLKEFYTEKISIEETFAKLSNNS